MDKHLCLGSVGICGLVALFHLVDLTTGFPLGRHGWQSVFNDFVFLTGSGLLGWQSWVVYKELS